MNTIRYAVIGTGSIAHYHLRDFSAKPGVEVVGLSDPSEANLQRAAVLHPKAQTFQSHDEMLQRVKPDVVSVCTPNKFHRPSVLAALAAGAHVACEKPMAMNVAEAEEMEAARRKVDRLGLINFSYRSVPSFRFARELIRNGELGKLVRVHGVFLQSYFSASSVAYSWRNDIEMSGFGALGDLGIHVIDAARFVTGLEMQRVVGTAQTLIPQMKDAAGTPRNVTTDTNAAFLTEFQNGMLGTFETTQVASGYGNYFRLEISGTKGTLAVLSEKDREIWLYAGETLSRYATWSATNLPLHTVPSVFVSEQPPALPGILVDVLRGKSFDYPTFQDGITAQKILGAILESKKTSSWVNTL